VIPTSSAINSSLDTIMVKPGRDRRNSFRNLAPKRSCFWTTEYLFLLSVFNGLPNPLLAQSLRTPEFQERAKKGSSRPPVSVVRSVLDMTWFCGGHEIYLAPGIERWE
jgi:hypothetical protein